MLRLLYLSDIHFEEPDCTNPRMDLASTDRDRLINDLQKIVETTGQNIDAILVTGDITYKAHTDEFSTAALWLKKIADSNEIDESRIFVVPGNHDVNRQTADSHIINSIRERLDRQVEPAKNQLFLQNIKDEQSKEFILKPMQNYNEFAKQYGCDLELPQKPFWTKYISIDDKYKLCLNGLTTTFFSNKDDTPGSLYLGQFQAYFEQKAGTINLAMFHHPKDWLNDGDAFDDLLSDNAQIWLSGHKHRQRYVADNRYLDLPSAAVNPSIWEAGTPGYNIIDISVCELGGEANLDIAVMMRTLQETPKQFVAKKTFDGKDILEHRIKIQKVADINKQQTEAIKSPVANVLIKKETYEKGENDKSVFKNLTSRVWNLQASKRLSVFSELDIEVKPDLLTNEDEFTRQALEIIKNKNLLDDFEKLIIEQEKI